MGFKFCFDTEGVKFDRLNSVRIDSLK